MTLRGLFWRWRNRNMDIIEPVEIIKPLGGYFHKYPDGDDALRVDLSGKKSWTSFDMDLWAIVDTDKKGEVLGLEVLDLQGQVSEEFKKPMKEKKMGKMSVVQLAPSLEKYRGIADDPSCYGRDHYRLSMDVGEQTGRTDEILTELQLRLSQLRGVVVNYCFGKMTIDYWPELRVAES